MWGNILLFCIILILSSEYRYLLRCHVYCSTKLVYGTSGTIHCPPCSITFFLFLNYVYLIVCTNTDYPDYFFFLFTSSMVTAVRILVFHFTPAVPNSDSSSYPATIVFDGFTAMAVNYFVIYL